MSNSYQQGLKDAQQGKGPKSPSDFKTHQEREKYNAGYNQGKK